MSWDPELLRKYSSTGHFRLLNQVRNELKAKPIIRHHPTKRVQKVIKTQGPNDFNNNKNTALNNDTNILNTSIHTKKSKLDKTVQSVEISKNPSIFDDNEQNKSSKQTKLTNLQEDLNDLKVDQYQYLEQVRTRNTDTYQWGRQPVEPELDNKKSFKERLSDIDMR